MLMCSTAQAKDSKKKKNQEKEKTTFALFFIRIHSLSRTYYSLRNLLKQPLQLPSQFQSLTPESNLNTITGQIPFPPRVSHTSNTHFIFTTIQVTVIIPISQMRKLENQEVK